MTGACVAHSRRSYQLIQALQEVDKEIKLNEKIKEMACPPQLGKGHRVASYAETLKTFLEGMVKDKYLADPRTTAQAGETPTVRFVRLNYRVFICG